MAAGLLSGITDFLFGSVDKDQYLQQSMQQQVEAQRLRQREATAYAAQQRYGQYLQAVMNGTAPSMAQLQLQQGLGAIQQNQMSMAAGIGGPGQALARYGAAQNIGGAQAQANQTAAMLRAKELADARTQYGANAQAMQQASGNMFGQTTNAGLSYAGLLSGTNQFNQQQQQQGLGALAQGIGQAAGSYFGRQPDNSGGGDVEYDNEPTVSSGNPVYY